MPLRLAPGRSTVDICMAARISSLVRSSLRKASRKSFCHLSTLFSRMPCISAACRSRRSSSGIASACAMAPATDFGIIGIRAAHAALDGGAGEAGENEYARVIRVLRGNVLLGDEIHPIPQWRYQAEPRRAIEPRQHRAAVNAVNVADRCPWHLAIFAVDVAGHRTHRLRQFQISGGTAPRFSALRGSGQSPKSSCPTKCSRRIVQSSPWPAFLPPASNQKGELCNGHISGS